jgi:hypothetical protein
MARAVCVVVAAKWCARVVSVWSQLSSRLKDAGAAAAQTDMDAQHKHPFPRLMAHHKAQNPRQYHSLTGAWAVANHNSSIAAQRNGREGNRGMRPVGIGARNSRSRLDA